MKMSNQYIVSIMSRFIIIGINFFTSIIITRYLGADLKGEYAYIFSFVGIVSIVLNLGIGQSYSYFKKHYDNSIQMIFLNIFYAQLILYFIMLIFLNTFYRNNTVNVIMLISIVVQFNSQLGFMSLINSVNKRNVLIVFANFIYLVLLIFFTLNTKENLMVIIVVFILYNILDCMFMIYRFNLFPRKINIDKKILIKILKLSIFSMISTLLISLNYNVDVIILKQFLHASDVGIYSVAVALASMVWIFPDAFKSVLFNKTANSDCIEELLLSIKINFIIAIIIIIGFLTFGKLFIIIAYGIDFVNAYSVASVLIFGTLPMIIFKIINTLYISKGKQMFTCKVLAVSVASNLLLNVILIPTFGLLGASISSVASYSICGFIFLLSFKKLYNLKVSSIIFFNKEELFLIKKSLNNR